MVTRQRICVVKIAAAEKSVSLLSGGSDYHADHKKGVANARQLGDAGVPIDYVLQHFALSRLCEGAKPS